MPTVPVPQPEAREVSRSCHGHWTTRSSRDDPTNRSESSKVVVYCVHSPPYTSSPTSRQEAIDETHERGDPEISGMVVRADG